MELERGKGSLPEPGSRNPGKRFSVNERKAMPLQGPRVEPNSLPEWAQGGAPGSSGPVDALPEHARGKAPLPMNHPDNLPEHAKGKPPLPKEDYKPSPYRLDQGGACEGGPDMERWARLAKANKGQGGAPSPGPSGPSYAGDGY